MEELIKCICDYISKPYTDYAIMLNGEWGSGKTHFWNNKLRARLENIKVADTNKNYKTIYISLYGINNLEDISKKIFIETNPKLNKSLKKFIDTREGNKIPEYVKTAIDMANLFGTVSFENEKIDFSDVFSIDDKILCFDDLERANVDVIDILGYINNFVEHDGIKTIVICNEKELATKFKDKNIELKKFIATYILDKENKIGEHKQETGLLKGNDKKAVSELPLGNLIDAKVSDIFDKANAYERIKEKLIGETFEYIPEYSYILSGMIMKYSYNEELSNFLKKNTALIISAFNKSSTRNLRILKHSLNDFEKIFTMVNEHFKDTPASILCTLLTFTIAVSFEIKAGNVSKEKLKAVNNNEEYMSAIFTSNILNNNNKFYLKEFDNKYFFNDNSKYKFFKFVEVYIRTRIFDEKLFKENMIEANNTLKNISKENKLKYYIITTGEYLKYSDFDFSILMSNVLEEVRQGDVEFKDHITLFAQYKYFITSGLLDMNIQELKQIFILGMQNAAVKINEKELLFTNNIETEDKDVIDINNIYNKIRLQYIDNIALRKASDLFKNLPNDIDTFYKQIISDYANLPVFAKYDMENLYSKLELTSNYDLYNLVNVFTVRYKDNKELFNQDSKNLKKLCDLIKKNKSIKEKTIKLLLLDNIAETIEKIEKELK